MDYYPEILLPRQTYPILGNEDIKDNTLVRETMINVYPFLEKAGYEPDDILPFVVAPQPSLREVFELSVFLYGYYEEPLETKKNANKYGKVSMSTQKKFQDTKLLQRFTIQKIETISTNSTFYIKALSVLLQ